MALRDKVCIITGASSGIGAETAKYFARERAILVLVGRNAENLAKVVELCTQNGTAEPKPVPIIADLCSESDVENIIKTTVEKFGRINVLVNNAGIIAVGSIENTSLKQYDNVMNLNVRAIYHLTMLAVPYLIETKGVIVNVSSVNGMRAFSGVLSYCISKAALDQFTRCIALELAPKGVRVNSVNPGVIGTEIHKRGGMDENRYEQFLEHSKTTHALGRSGSVDEVAKAIVFLATDSSSFTTGYSLPVDGGRHCMTSPYSRTSDYNL